MANKLFAVVLEHLLHCHHFPLRLADTSHQCINPFGEFLEVSLSVVQEQSH